jgi:hypothetical protein
MKRTLYQLATFACWLLTWGTAAVAAAGEEQQYSADHPAYAVHVGCCLAFIVSHALSLLAVSKHAAAYCVCLIV